MTRCPLKRVPSAARFFTLCRLTLQPPQSYSVGGQRSSGQLTGKPADARPDYRGRWCAVSQGHHGRPNPPSPRMTLGQLSAAPWELPSTVGCGIAWTRTGDVQAIERILHSSGLTVRPPQSYSVGGQCSSGQLAGKPAGTRPDYRGCRCALCRGHPGRPNPPSPRMTLGQLSAAPWELPSTVGCGIAWTRTGDVQAIERILHSSECFYWMRHSGSRELVLLYSGIGAML
ncbi:UNVERIFIED_CONTAM: hypothetical protein FKN15_077588 [Acipenser sinensis]